MEKGKQIQNVVCTADEEVPACYFTKIDETFSETKLISTAPTMVLQRNAVTEGDIGPGHIDLKVD